MIKVGPQRSVKTPTEAARLAKDGDIVEIDPGTYAGAVAIWPQDDLKIVGVRPLPTDRNAIRDALAATSFADHILPYQGPIEFDETGQAKNARSVILQVQDGQILQVLPAALAETEPIFPPPPWDER